MSMRGEFCSIRNSVNGSSPYSSHVGYPQPHRGETLGTLITHVPTTERFTLAAVFRLKGCAYFG